MLKKKILFICTGNTCRSPLAEWILKTKAGVHYEVRSAGIFAFPGSPASQGTTDVLKKRGISDIEKHQAQGVTAELLDWADVVLTMTENHKQQLLMQYPVANKVETLTRYVSENGDIVDPFGAPTSIYEKTAVQMEQLIEQFIKKDNQESN
ncbi:low molecular weight protein arginine phosphatase [Alkalihalobacillus pseudalcaliphilus]|uniref:low molecular weight protein arginine phosphatase n=1 Tax=Alkalihalobacillus pseudalcaliphilus TaxID=79884 RepID=UPI00064D8044|nr:low molecular weight protein arginine phosphatase [Alkalihalobacillus pseudalcaliphilus]KMK78266.1 phosphatase [Alkalihalobacillus pseudalcaliphilus]